MTTQPTPVTSVVATGELLARLSAEQQAKNMAVVGVLAVVILVGLLGNALVIAVYRPRPGGVVTSPAVFFILVMASLDLASCLLTVPYEILDLLRPYDNDNAQLCHAFRSVRVTDIVTCVQVRGQALLCASCLALVYLRVGFVRGRGV